MVDVFPLRFGKYLLIEKIAVGGMAEVFKAKVTGEGGFEKLVAIKKILPHLSSSQEFITMFMKEARLAALLNHPNLAQIYDFGNEEGIYYIAMEYVWGKTLKAILIKSNGSPLLSLDCCLYITLKVCAGLEYAHNVKDLSGNLLNIIHRDIKPRNILITHQGEIKIIDFGIAKAVEMDSMTQVGTIKGTISSMSPEQACGKVLDRRSDIFSTGLILYEMVTGRKAYSGNSMESFIRICQGEFTPPEVIAPGLPAEVYEILHKALSRDPEARFQSCAEMQERLEGCLTLFSERQNSENLSRQIRHLFSEDCTSEAKEKLKMEAIPTSMREKGEIDPEKTILLGANDGDSEECRPDSFMSKKIGRLNIWWVTTGVCLLVLVIGVLLYLHPFDSFKANTPEKAQTSIQIEASEKAVDRSDNSDKAKTSLQNEASEKAVDRSDDLDKAMKLIQNGDSGMAIELFEKLSRSRPELSQTISDPYAVALLHEAVIAEKTDPEKGKHLLLRSLEIKPDNPKVYFELGKIYTTLKDFPAAIESYLATTRLDPSLPEAFFNLGFLYAKAEDYLKAEEMFLKTIHLSPPYLDEAYFNLAVVLQSQGKLEQSIQAMEKAVAINPQNAKAIDYLKKLKK